MLLPMPVLFALFFVFANTIEFRGVPFLWLPDLSRADPYYIIPIVMGLSMFVLSKVGQVGMPPNPQTKMMLYFMPVFLTLLFLNFRVRPEPVLRREQHLQYPATVFDRAASPAGAGEANLTGRPEAGGGMRAV